MVLLAAAAWTASYIATNNIAVLEPKGMIGEKEKELLIISSLLMLIVVIPVFIFTLAFAFWYRKDNQKAKHDPEWSHSTVAELCWWIVPCLIITVLGVLTWKSSHELNPFQPIVVENKKPLEIQVVALQWKWLFIYPEQNVASLNYVTFPAKRPINFVITADAPMNSFWIPQLGGQIYAMPAMTTKLHLIASEEGEYQGSSSNLSGTGFAGMRFVAKASSDEEFSEWTKKVKQSDDKLGQEEYQELVSASENAPVTFYRLTDPDLFNSILMKYQMGIKR